MKVDTQDPKLLFHFLSFDIPNGLNSVIEIESLKLLFSYYESFKDSITGITLSIEPLGPIEKRKNFSNPFIGIPPFTKIFFSSKQL